ncbi:MAG: hypothetical protein WC047_01175 [Kiritimatiellales bacterium]
MNRKLKPILFFAAILGFFLLTVPANHSEAEDAYFYARMAEQGAWPGLFHMHHLIYLPLMRMIFRAVQLVGYNGRAFPVLTGVSMICGALTVCLFAVLLQRMNVKKNLAWLFAGSLLFSYGFWRYSTTVEIYTPAAALSLLAFYCAVRSTDRPFFWGSVLAGSLALLLHLVTISAVLLAVPLFYLLRRQKIQAALYILIVLLITGAGYGLVFGCGIRPEVFNDALVQRGTLLNLQTWISALIAWGQTVFSGNFLFSIPFASQQIVRLLPFQMLQEELFMGRQAPFWVPVVAPVTFGLAIGLAVGLFCVVLRHMKQMMANRFVAFISVLVWFAGAAAMALCSEPANPEMWICVLPPFWLLSGLAWNAVPESRCSRWMPFALAAVLLLHNWAGGMSLVKSPEGDYCQQKGAWIIEQAGPEDLILTADSHSFVTFLQYHTPACVLDSKFANEDQWRMLQLRTAGRTFVFSDVIELLPPVAGRLPISVERIQRLGAVLKSDLQSVHQDMFGTVYQWISP